MYFGTFDPIHENHVGIARFAVDQGYAQRVYFIVNGDNPLKPGATPWRAREALVKQRLEAESDGSGAFLCLDLSDRERSKMDWAARGELCERIRADVKAELPDATIDVLQVIGQDAFENAVQRSSSGRGGKAGIFRPGTWRFLIFPRGGDSATPVQIPSALQRRACVAEGYVDPQVLSSTAIRDALARSTSGASGLTAAMLHPALLEKAGKLYQGAAASASSAPGRRTFFVHFLGGPGSGKGSLGESLETLGFRHISGGTVFRAANARAAPGALRGCDGQAQAVAKVFGAIAHVVSSWPTPQLVSFDGFLPKDFAEFEARVGAIDLVVELRCSDREMLRRLAQRGPRPHDVERPAAERVQHYLSSGQQSIRSEMLKSFDAGRHIVHCLDVDRPLDETVQDLLRVVREAVDKVGLAAGVDNVSSPLDDAAWGQALQALEANPRQSYNARSNADTLRDKVGSRALKNFNNLVKTVLIDWAVADIAKAAGVPLSSAPPLLSALDVASGRGGDQLKFRQSAQSQGMRLSYCGIDVADEQVMEALRRLRAERRVPKQRSGTCMQSARLFVGDVIRSAIPDLPWQQLVSVQFAIHYTFSSEAAARSFLQHALQHLCAGGILLAVTVDDEKLREHARHACQGAGLVVENELCRITFPSSDVASAINAGESSFGLGYHFALSGEGITGDEYLVPESELVRLLNELDVNVIGTAPFSQVLESSSGAPTPRANSVAAALQQHLGFSSVQGVEYSIYDRLGLQLKPAEVEVISLYKAYVGRRRPAAASSQPTARPDIATAVAEASGAVSAELRCGEVWAKEDGEPMHLN